MGSSGGEGGEGGRIEGGPPSPPPPSFLAEKRWGRGRGRGKRMAQGWLIRLTDGSKHESGSRMIRNTNIRHPSISDELLRKGRATKEALNAWGQTNITVWAVRNVNYCTTETRRAEAQKG